MGLHLVMFLVGLLFRSKMFRRLFLAKEMFAPVSLSVCDGTYTLLLKVKSVG